MGLAAALIECPPCLPLYDDCLLLLEEKKWPIHSVVTVPLFEHEVS
jgi:hypothetical protein